MKKWSLTFVLLAMVVSSSWGQTRKARTLDDLVVYSGKDRHQILLEADYDNEEAELIGVLECWSNGLLG
jgi:hypothetical protein